MPRETSNRQIITAVVGGSPHDSMSNRVEIVSVTLGPASLLLLCSDGGHIVAIAIRGSRAPG